MNSLAEIEEAIEKLAPEERTKIREQLEAPAFEETPEFLATVELDVPSPKPEFTTANAANALMEFAKITKKAPRDVRGEQAFLTSKLHAMRTHPTLGLAEREKVVADFMAGKEKLSPQASTGPVPGGVGYGMYYNDPFKTNFATGTALYWDIICPNVPGGNVNNFLYLTATNRASKSVEAFVSYYGQSQPYFKVFDWARFPAAPWQTNIPFANLGNYLRTDSAHGNLYQVLPLMNFTFQSGANFWYNQVWLWNHVFNRWDLIYQYGYPATLQDQKAFYFGSWGPIVETFQNFYLGTRPMGAVYVELTSRNASNQWGAWHFLGLADSYVRTDNQGFHLLFLDPNYTWAVHS